MEDAEQVHHFVEGEFCCCALVERLIGTASGVAINQGAVVFRYQAN